MSGSIGMQTIVEIELAEVIFGTQHEVEVDTAVLCKTCQGSCCAPVLGRYSALPGFFCGPSCTSPLRSDSKNCSTFEDRTSSTSLATRTEILLAQLKQVACERAALGEKRTQVDVPRQGE